MTIAAAFKPLTKDDLGEVLGVSQRTIENWVNDGTIPAPRKLGNRVYWHPNTFYGWLDQYLTAGVPECAEPAGAVSAQQVTLGTAKPKPRPKTRVDKTESGRLRIREQAKLEGLLA